MKIEQSGCWLKRDADESGWSAIFEISAERRDSNNWIGTTFKISNGSHRMECKYRTSETAQTTWYVTSIDTYIPKDEWVFFVVAKEGTTLRMFANGQLINTHTVNKTMYNGHTPIYVGCCHSTTAGNLSAVQQFFSGQIDEFFFIKGVALYTSNFEVPTTPFGGYIELKYIESTGVQYINTGFKSNQNTRFLGQISYYNVSSSTNAFSSKEAKNFCPEINSNNKLITYYGGSNHTFEIDAEGTHMYDLNKNVHTIDSLTYTYTSASFQSSSNVLLFASTDANGKFTEKNTHIRLHYFKIYDNDVLVRDFIPILDEEGIPCLFDKVEKKFYYNQRKENFISSYTNIKYIESTGTQYIDTGFKINSNCKAEYSFMVTNETSDGWGIAGSHQSSNLDFYFGFVRTSGRNLNYRFENSFIPSTTIIQANTKYDVEVSLKNNNQYLKINGVEEAQSNIAWESISPSNCYIFAINGISNNRLVGRIYYFKVYENDTLVKDFIPVLDPYNTPCLFDKVEGKFYYNQGEGTFNYPSTFTYGDGSANTTIGGYVNTLYLNGDQIIPTVPSKNYGNYFIPAHFDSYSTTENPIITSLYTNRGSYAGRYNNRTYITTGTNLYKVPFDASQEDMTCWIIFRGGGLTSSITIGDLAFKCNGTLKSLSEMVADNIIKPIVLINCGGTNDNYIYSNILDLYSSSTARVGPKGYTEPSFVFMLNKGNVISEVQLYSSKNYNTTYDGLGYLISPTDKTRFTLNEY